MVHRAICAAVGSVCVALPLAAVAFVNVTSWRYDETRTGQNVSETVLKPTNVNATQFGKLYSYSVDGFVYAQPLYVAGVAIAGASHNVLFVATEHDSVFAFDADKNQQLWKSSLIDASHGAASGATTVPSGDLGTNDIVPEIGITGTPVIDTVSSVLYVVAKSKENGVYVHRLHALDLATGNEKTGSPVLIAGSVPGAGIGSVGGVIAFQPQWELDRAGLLLFNGQVFVSFAAHGDNGPYHGWIFAYNESNLKLANIFNTSPNGKGNGIWQSGAALAADTVNGVPRVFFAAGNFFSTGNFSSTPAPPYTAQQNYSNSIVRLDVTGGVLRVSDEWTPFDQEKLSDADADQTSGGVMVLPDQTGPTLHELIQVGKNGRIEVLDRDNLGGFNTDYNNVVQEITGQIHGLWSTPAYWNGNVYFWGSTDTLKQFKLTNGRLSGAPVDASMVSSNFPGATAVISSNGNSNGVLWAVVTDGYRSNGVAVLHAFDANNVSTEFYNSAQNATRDAAGKAVKFVLPVVTGGKVYVGTQGEVDVYGELATATPTVPEPILTPGAGEYAAGQSIAMSDTLGGAAIYYTTDGTTPSSNSTRYMSPINLAAPITVQAFAVASGYSSSSVVSEKYSVGVPAAIDFSSGFASVKGLTLNGSAMNSDDSRLQLTTGGKTQAGSAFSNALFNIQSFETDFTFQLSGTLPIADGITFTIQAVGPNALGPTGGGLGYGPDNTSGAAGIAHSVAVKFDVYNNRGEGADSTGLYLNGASPTVPAVDLTPSHVVLSSGDTLSAHIAYDGSFLYLTIKDPVNRAVYTGRFAVDIPKTIGATSAYIGFTGGSGGTIASQKILTWTFTPQPVLHSVQYQSSALPATTSGPTFRKFAWSGFPDGMGTVLDSDKPGDYVTLVANIATGGSYDLHVTSKDYYVRGIWQLSIDGLNVGSPQDEYSATEQLGNFDLGSVVLGAGEHSFKFTVTGKNPHSTEYKISFDTLSLDQR